MMTAITATPAESIHPAVLARFKPVDDNRPRMANGALRQVHCRATSMRPQREDAEAAFEREGMKIADYEVAFIFLVHVLTECGNFYEYDGSNGCGQVFNHRGTVDGACRFS